jgi:DNA processing protein
MGNPADDRVRWLVMSKAQGVGRRRLSSLMNACPDPREAWRLPMASLATLDGWNRSAASGLTAARRDPVLRRAAEAEVAAAEKGGVRLRLLTDPDYPARLAAIPDPPPILYQKGPWRPDDRPAVAIVGTRKPTPYGVAVAERFAAELAEAGAVVISGMAIGVDAAAHRGSLRVEGLSVAVLGSGVDVCYPRQSSQLYERLAQCGAILSELPLGTGPRPEAFPERNRIISGLAHCVVVVEAGERSGTLITVQSALEQGRDVFAVPGPIWSPMSVGPHRLILDGATPALSAAQILVELGFTGEARTAASPSLAPEEARLLAWMGDAHWSPEDLSLATGLPISGLQALLTLLTVRGFIQALPGGQFVRVGETGAIGV